MRGSTTFHCRLTPVQVSTYTTEGSQVYLLLDNGYCHSMKVHGNSGKKEARNDKEKKKYKYE